jgi:predicted nucleic-acid-binding Zn-ribbon protein
MPLDDEQRLKVARWFKSKKVNPTCPSCGHNEWQLGDIIMAMPLKEGVGLVVGGSQIPMVQVICTNCAYVRLYAAMPFGLLGKPKEKGKEK